MGILEILLMLFCLVDVLPQFLLPLFLELEDVHLGLLLDLAHVLFVPSEEQGVAQFQLLLL